MQSYNLYGKWNNAQQYKCNCSLKQNNSNNVQWSIRGTDVACCNEDYVNNCPDSKAAKTKQFANSLAPQTEIESIGTKSAKSDATTSNIIPQHQQLQQLWLLHVKYTMLDCKNSP